MTVASEEEMSLHAYLLGGLPLDEQMRLEERLLLDREYVELLLIVEEELIDDYLRGTLSDRDRARFETHFLITPDRRQKLRRARVLRRYVNNAQAIPAQAPAREAMPRASWWQVFLTPAWRPAIAAFLMLGLGLGIWRVFYFQSLAAKGRASLQAALRESPVEARIGGFDWPPQRITLGSQPDKVADKTSLESAQRYLLDAVTTQPGPDSYYALGQFYLAKGELDSAIEQFDRALEGDPKNARLHSDLGAALMERARVSLEKDSGQTLQDFNQSLEHLNEARALDDSLLEPLFNLALCHQYMQILSQAEVEWQEYLKRDSSSRWADEARRHLKDVEEKKQRDSQVNEGLLQGFLTACRANDGETAWKVLSGTRELITGRLIWWKLLDDFFNSTAGGLPAEPGDRLQALRYVGKLELHLGDETGKPKGDPYISELEAFYRKSSAGVRAKLAEAHNKINEGNVLFRRALYSEACGHYVSAREILKQAGDVWETLLTDYLIGICHTQNGETDQSLQLFSRLVTDCRNKGYLWLLGQSLYSLGMVQDRHTKHSEAIENTEEALRISEQINDLYNIQRSLAQIADQYKKLANYELATTYLNRCLKQMSVSWPGIRQMWRNCDQLTQVLAASRLDAAATDYANEALRLALETGDSTFTYVSYVHLALLRARQQDYSEALELAQLGLEAAPEAGDPRAYASVQMGHLHRQAGDLRQALYDYDQSIKYIDLVEESKSHDINSQAAGQKTNRLPALRYDAHKGRLFCILAGGGDIAAAEKELETTVGLLEKHRESVQGEQNRNTFFDREQSVYDAAIDFEYSRRGNSQAVFDYSEKSRARSLLDSIATSSQSPGAGGPQSPSTQPLSLSEIQSRMPNKTQLVEYAALDDKLLICLVSKTDFSVTEVPISLGDLTDKVMKFRQSILRREPDVRAQAHGLFGLLIDPINLSPEKGKQICFVADKVLNGLPFSALASASSDRYMVEDYQLILSPSATVYIVCSERKNHLTDTDRERLLAVGDPSFDRATFASLPLLPSTRAQVESIGQLYSAGSPILTGGSARKDRVKQEMENSDVIQVSSHYVVYEGSPMNSRLLLAREPEGRPGPDGLAGSLRADEVPGLRLQGRAPLVVLSACDSGVEHYYNGEGMIGMSRVFIVAGAPVVVASLWQVEAHATDELMINFHGHRKRQRMSSADALTEAQRDMLSNRMGEQYQHPYYWAGFTAIGAHTDF